MNKKINGEESDFPCRRIPKHLCRYSAFKEVKPNFLAPVVWAVHGDFLLMSKI